MTSPSPRIASPWDALLLPECGADAGGAAAGNDDMPAPEIDARVGTKVAGLLAELHQVESALTLALAVRCDLTPRQVWGLLKGPRAIGQVRFEDGRWSLVADFAGREVERSAELLRSKGWLVVAPNRSAEEG